MRVAVLNNDFRAYWKGRLRFLHQHLASNNTNLFAVELFGKGSPYDFDSYNNTEQWWVCLFPDQSADNLTAAQIKAELFKKLDELNPDVIIAPSIVFFAGAIGIKWAKENKRKFIMFDDARRTQVKRSFVVQLIKDTIIGEANGLWLPSPFYDVDYAQFLSKGIHSFYGFSCIDNSLFSNDKDYAVNSRKIICVARLVPIKNIDNLLRAWQKVELHNNKAELVIVGEGPEMQMLQVLKQELNIKRITFTGAIANDEIPALFADSAAFILPSLSETWGLVVNEAMAAGLPVLLSHTVNAAQSLLQEGVNGYGFDPLSKDQIADAVLRFMQLNAASRSSMSAASLAIVGKMSYQVMGAQLLTALSVIIQLPYKKPAILPATIIRIWNGRYNTAGWDKL